MPEVRPAGAGLPRLPVTAFPVPGNHRHWWLTTLPSWRRLHAVPAAAVDRRDEEAVEELCEAPGPVLRAVCGLTANMTLPGVLSRFGLPRCATCCAALHIPPGKGTPVNERPP